MRKTRQHGLSYSPEYRAWQQMRLRCTDPKHKAWPSYGGRGIVSANCGRLIQHEREAAAA